MIGRRKDRDPRAQARELADRERHALEIHDNLVQGLTAIHWALEAGAHEQAKEATRATLAQAQAIIGELLGEDPGGSAFSPGSLRREAAARGAGSLRREAPAAHKP